MDRNWDWGSGTGDQGTGIRDWDLEQSPISNLQSQLFSTTIAAPDLTVTAVLQHALGQERFFWQEANSDTAYVGFGTAADLRAWGKNRFASIQTQARELFANAIIHNNANPDAGPRLFGGFSFRDDFTPDNTWSIHHPAQFILPHYQFTQSGSEGWLTINAVITDEENPAEILRELEEALHIRYEILQQTLNPTPTTSSKKPEINYPMSYEQWQKMIEAATHATDTTNLNKVVLSRVCEIKYDHFVDVDGALAYLSETYPDCHRFLFEPRPYHAFYGATPELLAKVYGRSLRTMGLAGSYPRGKTQKEDKLLAQELLTSNKNRYEHALVVDSIRRRLLPIATNLKFSAQPSILQLGYIHHLYTPIQATLKEASGILPAIEILHPTPALGGSPRELAMQFIQQHEPVPRGWYGAPVGWIDHELNGAFCVAIRSAITQERRVWLYSGAGIVNDSIPEKEWEETAMKFKPMLNALEL